MTNPISEFIYKWREDHREQIKDYKYGFKLIWKNPLMKLGLIILIALIFIAIFAPLLATYPDHATTNMVTDDDYLPPSSTYLMGTDRYGRDVFSNVLFGTRIALTVAVATVGLALLIGVPLGAIAGYYSGWVDEIIMRITDMFLAFPAFLLAIVIAVTMGPSLTNAMIAIAIAWWPWYTRIVRSVALSIRERPFMMAAKASALKTRTIIFKMLLPNCLAPIVVQATLDMGTVILACASWGFLGLTATTVSPDWGVMTATSYYATQYWWASVFPGIAIFLTVLCFNLMGDTLREFLDPRIRLM